MSTNSMNSMNINKWLELKLSDRLQAYKSSWSAGKYSRSKRQTLHFCSELVLADENADVFILSL